jgi:hypothetical protein
MTDTQLPPIKGARSTTENPSLVRDNDTSDMTATREISATALESDRALIKPAGSKKSAEGDIESGKVRKNRSKKVSPEA